MEKQKTITVYDDEEDFIELPRGIEVKTFNPSSPLDEVAINDNDHITQIFEDLNTARAAARSVDAVCKLALTTIKVMEARRKALSLPWGDNEKETNTRRYLTGGYDE